MNSNYTRKPRNNYLDVVNHSNFVEANQLVHKARQLLLGMDMSQDTAYAWIQTWASGAGDGIK